MSPRHYLSKRLSDFPSYQSTVQALSQASLNASQFEIGTILLEQLCPIINQSNKNHTMGWIFQAGIDSLNNSHNLPNECTVFFMGTANTPLFCRHHHIRIGGDVLSVLALQKAQSGIPTLIMNGIATQNVNPFEPIFCITNPHRVPQTHLPSAVTGSGIHQIVESSISQFILPTLFATIGLQPEALQHYTLKLSGHSRGCLNALVTADCVDKLIYQIKQANIMTLKDIKSQLHKKYPHINQVSINTTIDYLHDPNNNLEINCLLFDPVEGAIPVGDNNSLSKNNPTVTIDIKGLGSYPCQFATVSKRVSKAYIFIAESDHRVSFQATLPTFHRKTQLHIFPTLGTHSTLMGNIGNHNGLGQNSYKSVANYPFILEAAQTISMLTELRAEEFLFNTLNQNIRYHLIHNVLAFENPGFLFTKQYVCHYLFQLIRDKRICCDPIIEDYITSCASGFKTPISDTIIDTLLPIILTSVQNDLIFKQNIVNGIKADIFRSYLASNDPRARAKIDEWCQEMKLDSTSVGFLSLALQPLEEERHIWFREVKCPAKSQNLSSKYPFLKRRLINQVFVPQMPLIGGNGNNGVVDPYLSDVFLIPDIQKHIESLHITTQLEINTLFHQISLMGMNHLYTPSYDTLNETQHNTIYEIFNRLIEFHVTGSIDESLFVALSAILILKLTNQYHYLRFDEAMNIVMLHFQNQIPFKIISACLEHYLQTSKQVFRNSAPTHSDMSDYTIALKHVDLMFELLSTQFRSYFWEKADTLLADLSEIGYHIDLILYRNGLLEYLSKLSVQLNSIYIELNKIYAHCVETELDFFVVNDQQKDRTIYRDYATQIHAINNFLETEIIKKIHESKSIDQIIPYAQIIQKAISILAHLQNDLPENYHDLLINPLLNANNPVRYFETNINMDQNRFSLECRETIIKLKEKCELFKSRQMPMPLISPLNAILHASLPDENSPKWSMPQQTIPSPICHTRQLIFTPYQGRQPYINHHQHSPVLNTPKSVSPASSMMVLTSPNTSPIMGSRSSLMRDG